ncbi:MAG: patatin-like phospholipase family protein [Chloroflexales bacterium]
MSKKRVALVLSGGVSLGSYIAGALDELLRQMAQSDQYEIDIITGASAGATTAAIIAHALLYRNADTLLHQIWVDQIDSYDMLDPDLPTGTPFSLLSNRHLQEISRQALTLPPGYQPRRSPLCADQLELAMTITNLDALSYESRVRLKTDRASEPFIQDRHSEQETFQLVSTTSPTDPLWGRVATVALASAALPMIFPPIAITRKLNDQTGPDLAEWRSSVQYIQSPVLNSNQPNLGSATFLYADGGLFNNLPIDLAWHYVQAHDGDQPDPSQRIMIIVDPSKDRIQTISLAPPSQRGTYRNPLIYLGGLIMAMYREGGTIQFDHEVPNSSSQVLGALPGVDRPEVEALYSVDLVLPDPDQPHLIGAHLVFALAAFLDSSFREYDFRRGAADARAVAQKLLGLTAEVTRPEGELFYTPDSDPRFKPYPTNYATLNQIPSIRFPGKSVRAVLESRLRQRLSAVIRSYPVGDFWVFKIIWAIVRYPISWLLTDYLVKQLPDHWAPDS